MKKYCILYQKKNGQFVNKPVNEPVMSIFFNLYETVAVGIWKPKGVDWKTDKSEL